MQRYGRPRFCSGGREKTTASFNDVALLFPALCLGFVVASVALLLEQSRTVYLHVLKSAVVVTKDKS
jgi:hypothetical protein